MQRSTSTHPGLHCWFVRMLAVAAFLPAMCAFGDAPTVVYEKTLAQFGSTDPHDIAVNAAGEAYVLAARPGSDYATLVVKLDSLGEVIWSRWFDGSGHDIPGGIALDAADNVYVVGTTGSDDLPLVSPYQAQRGSVQYDAFVFKLAGSDGTLLYSTLLGASRSEWGNDIAVNAAGEMYIVGETESLDFPTVNPLQAGLSGFPYYGWSDGYIAKFSADGSQLLYSTFFGGYNDDAIRGIALDDLGRIYLAGHTDSDDFPTVNPVQAANGGGRDAFAARISADGSSIEYSTYLGGEEGESVGNIALDDSGRLHFNGHTQSMALPTTAGAFQTAFAGVYHGCDVPFGADYNCDDTFIASLEPDGSAFSYVTYLGGTVIDKGSGLAVDSAGRVYAAGHTKSDNFPPNATGTFFSNYVTRLDAAGANLDFSVFHDTVVPSLAYVALDGAGDIYTAVTVQTPPVLVVIKLGAAATLPGDFNRDGSVDMEDAMMLTDCMAGPGMAPSPSVGSSIEACRGAFDFDLDDDVDLWDFSQFEMMFTRQ